MTHSTITSKGQTTLPVQIRRALHLKAGDKIQYEIQSDAVIIRPHPGVLSVFGALKPSHLKVGIPFEKVRSESREKWLEDRARDGSL